MKTVLVYGDSLSWGIVPGTRKRLPFTQRWPGAMELALQGKIRVIEDCLNGRRTVWEDPFKPGRNGLVGLGQRMEVNSPLDLAIVMLGSNDFQFSTPFTTPWSAAQGVASIVGEMRRAPIEPGMLAPPILIVTPPALRQSEVQPMPKFEGAHLRSAGLSVGLEEVAKDLGCAFFDASQVAKTSATDGVHLDADQHELMARAMADEVTRLLFR
ncbi:MAG: GDSL family lipase [Acidobacteria bacterium]|nr:GDSL family lipase [Acidobacteriota bacterium]